MNRRMDVHTAFVLQCIQVLGLQHKVPQSWGLKTSEMSSLTVWKPEAQSTPRVESFLSLPAPGGCRHSWLVATSLQPLLSTSHGLSSVCVCPNFPLVIRTPVILNQGPQTAA